MKANAAQIRKALGRTDGNIRLFLLHGPDEAGAYELAALLAAAMGATAERFDLDPAVLKADPARLADEAASLSLFGEARYIRVTGAGEESLDAFAALLEAENAVNPVMAIAPSVRTAAKIVKLAIASPFAMAYACYPPEARDAERSAVQIASDHGLRPASGVPARLVEASGNDRAILTREIEKFALYLDAAADRPKELDHHVVDLLGADAGDTAISAVVDAIVEGRVADLGTEFARTGEAGASPIPWLRQLARRLIALAQMRSEIDRGENPATVMKRHRIFFREEAQTARTLRIWKPAMFARALTRINAAERAVMAPNNAGRVLAEAEALTIARGIAGRA